MRARDIIIGNWYRHKDHPRYAYAKPIKILKPKELPNTNNFIVVKCEWSVSKDDKSGIYIIKYFKPVDLVRPNEENSECE